MTSTVLSNPAMADEAAAMIAAPAIWDRLSDPNAGFWASYESRLRFVRDGCDQPPARRKPKRKSRATSKAAEPDRCRSACEAIEPVRERRRRAPRSVGSVRGKQRLRRWRRKEANSASDKVARLRASLRESALRSAASEANIRCEIASAYELLEELIQHSLLSSCERNVAKSPGAVSEGELGWPVRGVQTNLDADDLIVDPNETCVPVSFEAAPLLVLAHSTSNGPSSLAAVCIQAAARRFLVLHGVARVLRSRSGEERDFGAASLIQRAFREHKVRHALARISMMQSSRAACRIQAAVRGMQGRAVAGKLFLRRLRRKRSRVPPPGEKVYIRTNPLHRR